jgi:hypothetical protein
MADGYKEARDSALKKAMAETPASSFQDDPPVHTRTPGDDRFAFPRVREPSTPGGPAEIVGDIHDNPETLAASKELTRYLDPRENPGVWGDKAPDWVSELSEKAGFDVWKRLIDDRDKYAADEAGRLEGTGFTIADRFVPGNDPTDPGDQKYQAVHDLIVKYGGETGPDMIRWLEQKWNAKQPVEEMGVKEPPSLGEETRASLRKNMAAKE